MNYKEKNILFSVDGIYGYKENLEDALKKKFKNVYYIENYMPTKKTITFKILRELNNLFKNTFLGKYFKKIFDEKCRKFYLNNIINFQEKIDYFLVVAGREFSKEFIQDLKKMNVGIKCIIFLWDKLEYTSLKNSIDEFDYVFSFDKDDCKKYGYIFRPSFYIKTFKTKKKKYDLFYIGMLREENRYKIIEKFFYYSLQKRLTTFLKLIKSKKEKINFNFEQSIISNIFISETEYLKKFSESKVVIDIPFSKQKGLTLRVFQSLYFDTKVITTNLDIKNYDFYNEDNIYVISNLEDIEKIDDNFFKTNFNKNTKYDINYYSSYGFINSIFDNIKNLK